MKEAYLDDMVAAATQGIIDPAQALDKLPRKLAEEWPDAGALEITVALASGADAVQSVFGEDGESGLRAQQVWRQAAIVAVDLYYLTKRSGTAAKAADLLAYWNGDDRQREAP